MLRGIRKASSNWLGKIVMATVMGVLIVSFAVWGIADIFKGFGQSSLAQIGKTEISTVQFRPLPGHDPAVRLYRATLSRRTAAPRAAASDRRHRLGRGGAAEGPDRRHDPFPERAALDRVRQTRRRAGRHDRPALARGAGRLFRGPQDPVSRTRISQTVLCRD